MKSPLPSLYQGRTTSNDLISLQEKLAAERPDGGNTYHPDFGESAGFITKPRPKPITSTHFVRFCYNRPISAFFRMLEARAPESDVLWWYSEGSKTAQA
jgi:hypothetical protein